MIHPSAHCVFSFSQPYFPVTAYISYLPIAVLKHPDQGNLEKDFLWAFPSRGLGSMCEYMAVRAASQGLTS